MIAATKGFVRSAGLILAVSLPLISTKAHAVTVTVGTNTYEVGVVTGSYNDNSATLQGQPWWGSLQTASAFADALVATNSMTQNIYYFFAYNSNVDFAYAADYGTAFTGNTSYPGDYTNPSEFYATATLSASSVPEINAGSLSQALLMLLALWLVTWRRTGSRVA